VTYQPVDLPNSKNFCFIFWVKDKKATNLSFFAHPRVCFFMGGTMNKSFTRIIVAVVAAALLYVGVSYLTKPPVEQGSKEVTLIMSTKLEGEVNEVFKKTFKTDAEMLGDLLEEGVVRAYFTIELSGNKTDAYGRFIVAINEFKTEDSNKGPWWIYDSKTNETCVTAGYCSGIDATPVYDKDVFEFTFTDSFE
jgi:hypothetical protein